ncbi:MAG: ATP-binding protein [Bacteroidota bacterium]
MAKRNPTSLKESETVEFKERFNDAALKTLAAFVNTKGGSLYVGVKDDATLLSGGITDKAQQDVVSKTINVLGITPEVMLHHYNGNEFLEVKVKRQRPPVSARGKYYQRVGNTTREVTGDALKQLFLEGESWDVITKDQFSLEDLDHEEVQSFIQTAKSEGRVPAGYDKGDVEAILKRLGLIIEGELTHAAILLFGEDPQQYFPSAVVRIGRFRDEATIVADRTISGHLFNQVREAEEQIKSMISRRYDISGDSFQRKDVWQYPLAAVREALLNALVHRNYFEMSVKTQLKVFDEMLWIYNPGKLPGSLKVEDLKRPHSSHPRNRLIANTFYRAGLIEEWGSGIQRMTAVLEDEGLSEPDFEEQGDGFVAKLYGQNWIPITTEMFESLNERQQTAVELAKGGKIKASDLHEKFSEVSRKTITRDLQQLVEEGILKQEGKGKGTRYLLTL